MKVLVTGAAGFIGAALSRRLLDRGDTVIGLDNLNAYYDVELKKNRLDTLSHKNFSFLQVDLCEKDKIDALFRKEPFGAVVNLAAQAGVRYSLTNPYAYIDSNISGFMNILEGCRYQKTRHLVFASSSSVYGANRKLPFSVQDRVDHPVSLYAASKRSNELMAHCYSHLYSLPVTGLRFFTVYGPWGRPDMALFKFTKNILENKPIDVFNNGNHRRDFTYIDDIVEGVVRTIDSVPSGDPKWDAVNPDAARSSAPYRLYNIGNNHPVWLNDFITAVEEAVGKKAEKKMLPMQSGDVLETFADIDDISRDLDFRPKTSLREGVKKFVQWYREYYKI